VYRREVEERNLCRENGLLLNMATV
jgi:hypothetical protein